MSQQEDILFCNIAIQGGMVAAEDAKRCLAYANKVEASGKARPRIGSVFMKAKILSQQNVQRIYQAIEKRGISSAESSAAQATAGRPRGRGARQEPRRVERRPRARVDPRTLTIGIISLVALVAASMAMGIMVIRQRAPGDEVTTPSNHPQAGGSNTSTPAELKDDLLGGGTEAPASDPEKPANDETREHFRVVHLVAIQDARRDRGENYANALNRLANFKEQRAEYYELFPDLAQEVETEIYAIDNAMREDVNAVLTEAENLVSQGEQDEAARVLEGIRDRVTEELKAVIDERKRKTFQ